MRIEVSWRAGGTSDWMGHTEFQGYTVAARSNGDRELSVVCRDAEDVIIGAALFARGQWMNMRVVEMPGDVAARERWLKWQQSGSDPFNP